MTTHCAACGRQLKREPIMVNDLPMGPVCAAKAPAVRPAGRDLFGYDTEAAAERAKRRVGFRIEIGYKRALRDTRSDFAAARGRLGL